MACLSFVNFQVLDFLKSISYWSKPVFLTFSCFPNFICRSLCFSSINPPLVCTLSVCCSVLHTHAPLGHRSHPGTLRSSHLQTNAGWCYARFLPFYIFLNYFPTFSYMTLKLANRNAKYHPTDIRKKVDCIFYVLSPPHVWTSPGETGDRCQKWFHLNIALSNKELNDNTYRNMGHGSEDNPPSPPHSVRPSLSPSLRSQKPLSRYSSSGTGRVLRVSPHFPL